MGSTQDLPKWQKGQRVEATVQECVPDGSLIVSFSGQLLRVQNQTLEKFYIGQRVQLEVVSGEPLSFRLSRRRTERGPGLDVSV